MGYPHEPNGTPKVITDPSVPLPAQFEALKKLGEHRSNSAFSRVEIWTSNAGVTQTRKFITADEQKRREKSAKDQDKAASDKLISDKAAKDKSVSDKSASDKITKDKEISEKPSQRQNQSDRETDVQDKETQQHPKSVPHKAAATVRDDREYTRK